VKVFKEGEEERDCLHSSRQQKIKGKRKCEVTSSLKVDIVVKEKPKLTNPIVICGLPGSAFVGKLAVDHLITELSAKQLAEFYCDGFAPQVMITENGTVSLMKNEMFYWKDPDKEKRDLIFYTGDAQPATSEAEYALSEAVIDFLLKEYGSKDVITLGAFVTGSFVDSPKVYAAATDASLVKKIEELGCVLMREGAITGMNGLLLGMAKLKGMSGYTLLGETSGYMLDPKASESVLVLLSKITGISVSMQKMRERAKEAEAVLQTIERMRGQQQQSQRPPGSPERRTPGYIS
jgi:uncharacterized protein (TIGR00162 family)